VTGIVIEQGGDRGFAVKRNGTLMIRTASENDWQAMGNGLVLVFGANPQVIDWAFPGAVEKAWSRCVEQSDDVLEIVACRVVQAEEEV